MFVACGPLAVFWGRVDMTVPCVRLEASEIIGPWSRESPSIPC
jgi:hypothetical protein